MWKNVLAISLIASLIPTVANSEDAAAPPAMPDFKFDGPLKKIDKKVSALMGEDGQHTVRQLAEAAVLSDFCAAINLDQGKFKQAFDELASQGPKRRPAEQRDFEHKVAMYYGVYVGLFVAEGADRRAEFCGIAENALKNQKPISRFWLATDAKAAAEPRPAAPSTNAKPAATKP